MSGIKILFFCSSCYCPIFVLLCWAVLILISKSLTLCLKVSFLLERLWNLHANKIPRGMFSSPNSLNWICPLGAHHTNKGSLWEKAPHNEPKTDKQTNKQGSSSQTVSLPVSWLFSALIPWDSIFLRKVKRCLLIATGYAAPSACCAGCCNLAEPASPGCNYCQLHWDILCERMPCYRTHRGKQNTDYLICIVFP